MKLNKLSTALLAISLGSISGLVNADGYVGIGFGTASYDYSDVDDSSAFLVYGGYLPANSILGVEVAYIDMGKADITSFPGLSLHVTGFNVSAVMSSAAVSKQPLYFFGKLGYYNFSNKLNPSGPSDSGGGLSWGLGLGYNFSKQFGMRAEAQGFSGVRDFANDSDIPLINLGVEYHF
jgi:hypothetical protein